MKVKCYRNDQDSWLEIGKEYTIEAVDIRGYSSEVYLEGESKAVNSVQFMNGKDQSSIWDIPEDMQNFLYLRQKCVKQI